MTKIIIVVLCLLAIAGAAADLHCGMSIPSRASVVLACRASRLEAPR